MTTATIPTERDTATAIAQATGAVDEAKSEGRDLYEPLRIARRTVAASVLAGDDLRSIRHWGIYMAVVRDALPTWQERLAAHR